MDNWHDMEARREAERETGEALAAAEVGLFDRYGDPIGWNSARLIAAHWQASAGTGSVMASLATGAPFDPDALVDDVNATIAELIDDGVTAATAEPSARGGWTGADLTELRALLFFAERLDPDECEGEGDAM